MFLGIIDTIAAILAGIMKPQSLVTGIDLVEDDISGRRRNQRRHGVKKCMHNAYKAVLEDWRPVIYLFAYLGLFIEGRPLGLLDVAAFLAGRVRPMCPV